jgi:hypothetical protein
VARQTRVRSRAVVSAPPSPSPVPDAGAGDPAHNKAGRARVRVPPRLSFCALVRWPFAYPLRSDQVSMLTQSRAAVALEALAYATAICPLDPSCLRAEVAAA